jgi:hypothetical protein
MLWVVFIAAFSTSNVFAMGEKYSEQGHALYRRIFLDLREKGYCDEKSLCSSKIHAYGEHGDRVNLNFYGTTDKKIIGAIMECVAKDGLVVTDGVPITIRFYSKSKEELLGLKYFTKTPAIIMEINN